MSRINWNLPVDRGLPSGIGESVEHVEDEGAGVTCVRPVLLLICLVLGPGAVVGLLEHVSEAPDDHDGREKHTPRSLSTSGTADTLNVKRVTKDVGTDDLHNVVDDAIESSGADVEVCSIDLGEVVGVEPVGSQEHGEEKDDVWVGEEGLV